MSPLEQVGAVVLGLGALLGALTVVYKTSIVIGKQAWHALKAFGRWLVRFVKTVNVISDLPARLDKIDADSAEKKQLIEKTSRELSEHIAETKEATIKWASREDGIDQLLENQKVVLHEVKHNGGSSMKDGLRDVNEKLDALIDAFTTGELHMLPKRAVQNKEPVLTGPVPLA